MITYKVLSNDTIESSCVNAMNLSKFLGRQVSFKFNDIQMTVEPYSLLSDLIKIYRSKSKKS